MLNDILAFVAATKAALATPSNLVLWVNAATLGIKVAQDIIAILGKQGKKSHEAVAAFSAPGDLGGCLSAIEAECAKGEAAINWGNLLALVQMAIALIAKIVVGG